MFMTPHFNDVISLFWWFLFCFYIILIQEKVHVAHILLRIEIMCDVPMVSSVGIATCLSAGVLGSDDLGVAAGDLEVPATGDLEGTGTLWC